MMLELHSVSIALRVSDFSLILGDGQQVSISGAPCSGKTLLLRAVMGFLPVDDGHISIDGELLTPLSAPYFRRNMAYVPQELVLPEWYDGDMPHSYVERLQRAAASGKTLIVIDEPPTLLTAEERSLADGVLQELGRQGRTVLAVNTPLYENVSL